MKVQYRWLAANGTKSEWYDGHGDHIDEAATATFENVPSVYRIVLKLHDGGKLEYRRAK